MPDHTMMAYGGGVDV